MNRPKFKCMKKNPDGNKQENSIFVIFWRKKTWQISRFTPASKKSIIDMDEIAFYAARYIKYRGLRKCAVFNLGYWRSFRIGINSLQSRFITSMESFSVVRRRKTLQLWAATLKFTLYSCFVVPCFTTVWLISVSVML